MGAFLGLAFMGTGDLSTPYVPVSPEGWVGERFTGPGVGYLGVGVWVSGGRAQRGVTGRPHLVLAEEPTGLLVALDMLDLGEGALAVLAALDTSKSLVLVMPLLPRPSVRFPCVLVYLVLFSQSL